MKKAYMTPIIEITEINVTDIITASGYAKLEQFDSKKNILYWTDDWSSHLYD